MIEIRGCIVESEFRLVFDNILCVLKQEVFSLMDKSEAYN